MLFVLSLGVRALVLLSLCFTVLGLEHQLQARRLDHVIERQQSPAKRGICYADDTLESFKYWIVDSEPYCSSLLAIADFTRTVSRISRTTTTTVSVTYVTRTATATVPAVTIFSTIFNPLVAKREAAATTAAPNFYQENPYAYPVYAGDAPNASIASSYYSACSCLSLKPSTVDDTSIILSTRTIRGEDTRETISYVYVTTGTTTELLTRQGSLGAPTTRLSTISVVPTPPLITAPAVTSPVSSIVGSLSSKPSAPFPSPNTTLSLSNTFPSSGTRPTIAPTFSNLTSLSVPSIRPTISANTTTRLPTITAPSSGFPLPSANASLTTRPSSGFSSIPGNLSTSVASGFPTLSLNSTITLRPSSTFPPLSINSTINSTITLRPSSTFPPLSINSTINSTITLRPSSTFPPLSINSTLNSTITLRPSSTFPPLSINSSTIPRPSSGFLPSVSGLPTPSGNISVSSRPTVGFPTNSLNASSTRISSGSPSPYVNLSSSISGAIPTYPASFSTVYLTVTGPAISSSNTTLAYTQTAINITSFATTRTATAALNTTIATSTTIALTAAPTLTLDLCPGLNDTVITLADGQAFVVVCSTEYGGPTDIGLSEKSFNDCIQDCATTNSGFSAARCRAVTYFANRDTGEVNCNFKNLDGLGDVYNNPEGISAVLIEVPLLSTTLPLPTSFPTLLATPSIFPIL
ncbi:hypothetical protein XPA_004636 [Xanthoria parietina]